MHDVVVVGGGLAGSATAIHLARAGIKVHLIDRATFPRRKICGEGIVPLGCEQLDDLGVGTELMAAGAELHRLRIHAGGHWAEARLSGASGRALGIKRPILDERILERARAAGVNVTLGVTVTGLERSPSGRFEAVYAGKERFAARAFIAADGLRSRLRREAGLEGRSSIRRYGAGAHAFVEGSAGDCVDMYTHRDFEAYVTPVGKSEINVALLVNDSVAKSFSGNVSGRFRELVAAAVPRVCLQWNEEPLITGPFPARSSQAWRENLLLTGDAAGFFDGISGDGMSLALRAAPLAAEAARAYLATGSEEGFRRYNQQLVPLHRPSTTFSRLMLTLARRPVVAGFVLDNLAKHPSVFNRLVAVSSGELRFRDLRPRDLLAFTLGV